ncbi:MAG: diaminopimelate epimerase [Clostridiales Family XIII bacterium]|nr:diaminopimelate epimerase [Clostridiales Family XIII bacterium]
MRFVKYHGCGNDFVIMDEAELARAGVGGELASDTGTGGSEGLGSGGTDAGGGLADFARRICHRQLGVGADGLLVCRRQPLTMDIINSDGSVAPMCGNGVRCFARYCVEEGVVSAGTDEFDVHTLAGAVRARVSFNEAHIQGTPGGFTAEIGMGRPDWSARAVGIADGLADENGEFIGREVDVTGASKVKLSSFFMGTYHTVVWLDENEWILGESGERRESDTNSESGGRHESDANSESGERRESASGEVPRRDVDDPGYRSVHDLYTSEAVDRIGRALESHPVFTQRTNVDFARVTGRNAAEMITWERGAGLTAACGTGACAVASLGIREGRFDGSGEVRIALPYGELFIRRNSDGDVLMRGPAERVFSGEYEICQG